MGVWEDLNRFKKTYSRSYESSPGSIGRLLPLFLCGHSCAHLLLGEKTCSLCLSLCKMEFLSFIYLGVCTGSVQEPLSPTTLFLAHQCIPAFVHCLAVRLQASDCVSLSHLSVREAEGTLVSLAVLEGVWPVRRGTYDPGEGYSRRVGCSCSGGR